MNVIPEEKYLHSEIFQAKLKQGNISKEKISKRKGLQEIYDKKSASLISSLKSKKFKLGK